jgi:hypothetical protein
VVGKAELINDKWHSFRLEFGTFLDCKIHLGIFEFKREKPPPGKQAPYDALDDCR